MEMQLECYKLLGYNWNVTKKMYTNYGFHDLYQFLIGKNIVDFEAQSSMGNALIIHLAVFLYRQNPIGYCVTFSNLMVFDRGNLNK
jgi:hypothetical protein